MRSTDAPSATNRRASASPCPRAAPVTMATLPSSRPVIGYGFSEPTTHMAKNCEPPP